MKYRTIVADPPWKVKGGPLKGGVGEGFKFDGPAATRALPYPSMSVDEIASLRVAEMADENCALYLWTINAYVPDAYKVARAWGFKPSTLLVWAKNPMGGGLGGAFGISTEFILYARKGSPNESSIAGTWFNWKRPYVNGKPCHSKKPWEFYNMVRLVTPDGPRLEMFARSERPGWHVWGNECISDVELPA